MDGGESRDALYVLQPVYEDDGKLVDFRYVFVNEHAANRLNMTAQAVIGRRIGELFSVAHVRSFFDKYAQVLATGVSIEEDVAVHVPDVAISWLHHQVIAVDTSVIVISRDISTRKRRELDRQRLATLIEASSDAIFSRDRDGFIVTWNGGAERLLGYSAADVLGQRGEDIVVPELRTVARQNMAALMRGEHVPPFETMMRRKDGTVVAVSKAMSLLTDPVGRPIGSASFIRDMTHVKHVETKLRQSLMEKELLLKEVHHRVKNNLQVIASLLSLQAHQRDGTAGVDLAAARARVNTIALLHDRLHSTANAAEVLMREYVQSLASALVSIQSNHRIALTVEIPNDLTLTVDQATACGLLVNELLTNAFKHAFSAAHVAPRVAIAMQHKEGWLQLQVRDNGLGVSPTAASSGQLGFQIVRLLSAQLGGKAELGSVDPGTCWHIVFPRA